MDANEAIWTDEQFDILIATPIARVVFSIVAFMRQRDWLYVGVTAAVLALLAYSLLASS